MPASFRTEFVDSTIKCIATYNINRKLLLIINDSESVVYISKDPMYVKENGLPLYPYEIIVFDVADADEPETAFYAQALTGIAKLRIYEALVA